jgi:transcriptional regulator with XRE-family HTH domain
MPKAAPQKAARKVLAANILYARTMLGWSQEQLAEKAHLHRTQIGELERQTSGASVDSLAMLGRALGLPMHVLLTPPTEAHPLILAGIQAQLQKGEIDGLIEGKKLPSAPKRKPLL